VINEYHDLTSLIVHNESGSAVQHQKGQIMSQTCAFHLVMGLMVIIHYCRESILCLLLALSIVAGQSQQQVAWIVNGCTKGQRSS